MEVAYLENDKNELEITRPVSLAELDSTYSEYENLLVEIQNKDKIKDIDFTINLTEDFPNHYFRRVKNVSLQVFLASEKMHLNAEFSLTGSEMSLKNNETIKNRIGVQSVATSTAHLESGCFVFDFSKNKYSPFEGAGADSTQWTLSIPDIAGKEIEDIVFTICYTARVGKEGGN